MLVLTRRGWLTLTAAGIVSALAGCANPPATPTATIAAPPSPTVASPPPPPTITRLPLPGASGSSGPTDAATPVANASSPETAYLGKRQQEYAAMAKAMADLETQFAAVRSNASIATGSDWQTRTSQDLSDIAAGARQFQQAGAPPSSLAPLDASFASTGQDIQTVAGTITGAVQSRDPQQIAGAVSQIQRINSDLMKLNQQLGQAFQQNGLTRPTG